MPATQFRESPHPHPRTPKRPHQHAKAANPPAIHADAASTIGPFAAANATDRNPTESTQRTASDASATGRASSAPPSNRQPNTSKRTAPCSYTC